MTKVQVKRIYDVPEVSDGYRVLVDRLWPRGVSKEKAALDEWNKAVAPSSELRVWFGHRPERFLEFAARYEEELSANSAVAEFVHAVRNKAVVTLLYAAKSPEINHAIVLKRYVEQVLSR